MKCEYYYSEICFIFKSEHDIELISCKEDDYSTLSWSVNIIILRYVLFKTEYDIEPISCKENDCSTLSWSVNIIIMRYVLFLKVNMI